MLGGIAIDLESVCRPGPHLYSEHNARFDDGRDDLQRSESVPSGQCAKGDLHLYRDAHYVHGVFVHSGGSVHQQPLLWSCSYLCICGGRLAGFKSDDLHGGNSVDGADLQCLHYLWLYQWDNHKRIEFVYLCC